MLITGGGTGVGADLARGFAAAGADVVVVGRRREPLDAVAATDARITACVGDVTDEADVVRVFAELDPFDIVVANAGAADSAPLHARPSLDLWQRMLAVNLTGVFLTLREGLRQMRRPRLGPADHHRLDGRTEGLPVRLGLHRRQARCGRTDPGGRAGGRRHGHHRQRALPGLPGHRDDRTDASPTSSRRRAGARPTRWRRSPARNPQRRLIEPAEVTAAALWLCGPGSEAINGQAIAIAGGEL